MASSFPFPKRESRKILGSKVQRALSTYNVYFIYSLQSLWIPPLFPVIWSTLEKIELANATLTSSFALHPAMFKKLKFFFFFLLAINLATFKKFTFFFIYLGFFSRQFLFIYLNFKKTVLILNFLWFFIILFLFIYEVFIDT